MSISKPPLLWIGSTCYRGNPFLPAVDNFSVTFGVGYGDTQDAYEDDEPTCGDLEDNTDNINIEELPNGRFRAQYHIPKAYFGLIIGKKGVVKQRLEHETKVRISIPNLSAGEKEDVVITGDKKPGVVAACNRLSVMVQSARNREGFTHFVSIPLNEKSVQESFNEFKSSILNDCEGTRGLDETIFQDPCMLHLTICTLVLMDSVERAQAIEVLQDCKELVFLPLLNNRLLEVQISGLEIMNDDPSEVDVLYAKVRPVSSEDSDVLQQIADKIVSKFVDAGLGTKQYDRVKLHMTVINSLFRRDQERMADNEATSGPKKSSQDRETFNARPILEKFRDWDFGRAKISSVHLSQRRCKTRHEDGYYMPSVVVSLNSCG